jgi:hypothetical protein
MLDNYRLRHAAGRYWIINLDQPGKEYRKPIVTNETGAYLWTCWQSGATQEEMITALCQRYHIKDTDAQDDVKTFLENIRNRI